MWPAGVAEGNIAGPTVAATVTGVVGAIVSGMALAQVFVVAHRARSTGIGSTI